MHPAIAQHRAGIATICQRFRVSRLEVFGSAARADDFNPATSDVDFLIEFAEGATLACKISLVPRRRWNICWVARSIW